MRNAHACRVDANQPAIVDALRKAGCLVLPLNRMGNGCPDLLVCWAGVFTLLEVKTPTGQLTKEQRAFHALWAESRIAIVTTPESAIAAARACTEVP